MIYLKALLVVYSILLIFLYGRYSKYESLVENNFNKELAFTILFDRTADVITYLEKQLKANCTTEEMKVYKQEAYAILNGDELDG